MKWLLVLAVWFASTVGAKADAWMDLYEAVTTNVIVIADDSLLENKGALGLYDRGNNILYIADEIWTDEHRSEFWEVFVHETVHLIQDCKSGIRNSRDELIISEADLYETQRLDREWSLGMDIWMEQEFLPSYAPEDRPFEREAQYLAMSGDPELVHNLFSYYCL